jgi:endonuclease YncB( thermonuclease family)
MRRTGWRVTVAAIAACLTAGCEPGARVESGAAGARSIDTAGGVLVTQDPGSGGNVLPGGGPPAAAERQASRTRTANAARDARPTRNSRPDSSGSCVVRSVTDGDTVRCGDGRRVRLLLIDAPERSQPPFAERSRDALLALAPPGTRLRMELDVRATDQFGRTLAYLWRADGRMVNREMVRGGWAVVLVYPPNVRHVELMRAAADSARRERRGLHDVDGLTCEPLEHRRGRC